MTHLKTCLTLLTLLGIVAGAVSQPVRGAAVLTNLGKEEALKKSIESLWSKASPSLDQIRQALPESEYWLLYREREGIALIIDRKIDQLQEANRMEKLLGAFSGSSLLGGKLELDSLEPGVREVILSVWKPHELNVAAGSGGRFMLLPTLVVTLEDSMNSDETFALISGKNENWQRWLLESPPSVSKMADPAPAGRDLVREPSSGASIVIFGIASGTRQLSMYSKILTEELARQSAEFESRLLDLQSELLARLLKEMGRGDLMNLKLGGFSPDDLTAAELAQLARLLPRRSDGPSNEDMLRQTRRISVSFSFSLASTKDEDSKTIFVRGFRFP
ncbi:MAG: hypothetical protein MUC92_08890 [Fimbriimonadaceae bacterium]|jgi:hypothetical protein|nr:hypothetical protein [Fimbriimonadaceae bacterium]